MPQTVDEIFKRFSNPKTAKLTEEEKMALLTDKYITEELNNINKKEAFTYKEEKFNLVKKDLIPKDKIVCKIGEDTNYLNSSNIILVLFEEFKQFGYDDIKNLSLSSRKKALKNIIQSIKPKSVYRRLIALKILVKNKDIELYNILREDAKWVKELK
jgi:hypothetical protein